MQLQWEKRLSQEKGLEIASLREEIFREFEEQKKAEILETLEEAKEAWIEESEEQKREEVNEAMAYLESEYTKSLEEFKHKTLKEALEQARKQWTTEELSHREEIVKASVMICESLLPNAERRCVLQCARMARALSVDGGKRSLYFRHFAIIWVCVIVFKLCRLVG